MKSISFDGEIETNFLGHIFAEIFKDRVYDQFFQGRENMVVVDCGAHVGIWTLYASKYAKKIVSVEPDKDHYEALLKNIADNGLKDKVLSFNVAITGKDEIRNLNHNPNLTMSSLSEAVKDPSLPVQETKCLCLSSLFKEAKLDHVDFLKLDVEGVEPEIVCGEDFIEASKKIQSLVMEVHSWNGRHPNQLIEALKQNGFKVGRIPNDAQLFYAQKI